MPGIHSCARDQSVSIAHTSDGETAMRLVDSKAIVMWAPVVNLRRGASTRPGLDGAAYRAHASVAAWSLAREVHTPPACTSPGTGAAGAAHLERARHRGAERGADVADEVITDSA
ncbi:hypothetical protein ARHIZOSPH14_15300 [Agromyces rhizosphaerae]|uniref:Uncharacterized protein n=1 Tax=Agromyces rhizosphaerae TaxID=88374 RepID=A0A9W6FRN2_9MICO|nr:hypothetical protein ARHIZOSPH14_15300 [Agromyces rhizosphaerae]